jgi:HSP20 family molecular chaperone IbpA
MAETKLPMARVKTAPEICSYLDQEKGVLRLEVSLPGVKKEEIRLKMLDDSFNLSAPRGEDMEYVSAMGFCCPVKAKDAKADYENGLLKISVPFRDAMDDAISVTIA